MLTKYDIHQLITNQQKLFLTPNGFSGWKIVPNYEKVIVEICRILNENCSSNLDFTSLSKPVDYIYQDEAVMSKPSNLSLNPFSLEPDVLAKTFCTNFLTSIRDRLDAYRRLNPNNTNFIYRVGLWALFYLGYLNYTSGRYCTNVHYATKIYG